MEYNSHLDEIKSAFIKLLVMLTECVESQRNEPRQENVGTIKDLASQLVEGWDANIDTFPIEVRIHSESTVQLAEKILECVKFPNVDPAFGQDYAHVRVKAEAEDSMERIWNFVEEYTHLRESLNHLQNNHNNALALAKTVTMTEAKIDDAEAAVTHVEPYFKEAEDILSSIITGKIPQKVGRLPNREFYPEHLQRMFTTGKRGKGYTLE